MYLMIATCPDLCFQGCESYQMWQDLKKVLRYIKGTRDLKLVYRKGDKYGYADSDWAEEAMLSRSLEIQFYKQEAGSCFYINY